MAGQFPALTSAVEDRIVGQIPARVVGLLEWAGHSYPGATGLTRDQEGYVDRLARALGAKRRNNFSWPGASEHIPQTGANGDGGFAHVYNKVKRPGMAGQDAAAAPYLGRSQVFGLDYGLNALAVLGSLQPGPSTAAHRAMMAHVASSSVFDVGSAQWDFTTNGPWTTVSGDTTQYLDGTARSTTTADNTKKAQFSTLADYPGGLFVDIFVLLTANATTPYTQTWGLTIDGNVKADIVVDVAALTQNFSPLRNNAHAIRLDPAVYTELQSAGVHTVLLTAKSQTVAAQPFTIDHAAVEADPRDYLIVLPEIVKPENYTAYNGARRGPDAGTDPMVDASVNVWNAARAALAAEFPGSVVIPATNNALGKLAVNFQQVDHVHPTSQGHTILTETDLDAIRSSALVTQRLASRSTPMPGPYFQEVGMGFSFPGFLCGYLNSGGVYPTMGYHRHMDGRVELRGGVNALTAITRSGTLTNGNAVVTGLSSTADLAVGMTVSGTGIQASTTILTVDSASQITMNKTATQGGAQTLTLTGVATSPVFALPAGYRPATANRHMFAVGFATVSVAQAVALATTSFGATSNKGVVSILVGGHAALNLFEGTFAAET